MEIMQRGPQRDKLYPKGLTYLREAHKILIRDFKVAFEDQDWNIAVRRAQECVEFAVKGALLIPGEVPPKKHVIKLPQNLLEKFPIVAFQLTDDPRSESVICFLEGKGRARTLVLHIMGAKGAVVSMALSLTLPTTSPLDVAVPFGLRVEENSIRFSYGPTTVVFPMSPLTASKGQWTQTLISKDHGKLLNSYVRKLSKQRDDIFYFNVQCSQADAERAEKEAWDVLRIVMGSIGLQVGIQGQ